VIDINSQESRFCMAYGGVDVYTHISLTTALVGGEWSASRPGRLPRGERLRYPLDRKLGGPQSLSGRRGEEKILDYRDPNTSPSVAQPVASRYTDYAIRDDFYKALVPIPADRRIMPELYG
jgi:hypothetical protein